ncbi:hypothetical protein [Pseudomonas anguilliseptica]|uniref:hypothetical protein n=1 Tax=Pseudomonas anguilliseptica TaxID=53406 RepID=UPI00325B5303
MSVSATELLPHTQPTPLQLNVAAQGVWQQADELLIEGVNQHPHPIIVVLRLDDEVSWDYATRFNREWQVPPGPFLLSQPLSGLRDGRGREMSRLALRRLYLFHAEQGPAVQVNHLRLFRQTFPEQVVAWDMGAAHSACSSGFRCMDERSLALQGVALEARQRPYADALLADGIRGIAALRLPLAAGRWRLLLWQEDVGEWEYLPHVLHRELRLNGERVRNEHLTPEQWYSQRYLAGREREWQVGEDAWQALGRWRGEALEQTVEVVQDQGLLIEMTGEGADAQYLSGLLAWPADDPVAEEAVRTWQRQRAQRFAAQWPVQAQDESVAKQLQVRLTAVEDWLATPLEDAQIQRGVAGSRLFVGLRIDAAQEDNSPVLLVTPPLLNDQSLPVQVHFGHWRLERPQAASTLLVPGAGHLRADLEHLRLRPGQPRRLLVSVQVSEGAAPGVYVGNVQVYSHGAFRQLPYRVQVLAVQRTPQQTAVGLYHERLPALGWFSPLEPAMQQLESCDWQRFVQLGLSTVAPALPTPDSAQARDDLAAQVSRVQQLGLSAPLLAYAPLKRLRAGVGDEEALQRLRLLSPVLRQQLWWAVADEPAVEQFAVLQQFADQARAIALPLAWQLNHPEQQKLLKPGDLLLANPGFGVDVERIAQIEAQGVKVWLYNLGRERLAAGFYLWRSQASGLLQWHARMPTADPFDSTDGREADFNYLWPQALMPDQRCAVLDMDARLVGLSQGMEDLRWLQWLDQQASVNEAARRLRKQLWQQVPTRWEMAQTLQEKHLQGWREAILDLAQQRSPSFAAPLK